MDSSRSIADAIRQAHVMSVENNLSKDELRTLLAVVTHAVCSGKLEWSMTMVEFAEMAGCDPRSCRRAVMRLSKLGVITRLSTPGRRNGSFGLPVGTVRK